ncbi:MAG: hypothetical protein C0490_13995 [Marivirga sp.]|nr:hypothetical protein [Marivirga sp.]
MKNILLKKIGSISILALVTMLFLSACEQEGVTPELNAAPGGGTVTTFKAYTLDSIPGAGNIYGRVVFWLDNASNTLVQVSLYNTKTGVSYPSGIFQGTVAGGSTGSVTTLTPVDGEKGEFSPYKFFVIDNDDFFDGIDDLDAHVTIFLDATPVAVGDVGKNAEPVLTGE